MRLTLGASLVFLNVRFSMMRSAIAAVPLALSVITKLLAEPPVAVPTTTQFEPLWYSTLLPFNCTLPTLAVAEAGSETISAVSSPLMVMVPLL